MPSEIRWIILRSNVDLPRSEEHTSELQSRFELVCRLLLEKKNELEPVVLRDQVLEPAVRALTQQHGIAVQLELVLHVEGAETLAQRSHEKLYQLVREAIHT